MGIEFHELDAVLGNAGDVVADFNAGTGEGGPPRDAAEDLPGVVGELLDAGIGTDVFEAAVEDEVGAGGGGSCGNSECEEQGYLVELF